MTSLLSGVRRGSQTPRVANFPPYDLSAAPEVIDLAAHAGLYLDEWQQYVLTHGLGMRRDGSWTAPKVSVWVPRQNGKGGIIEALELAWLFLFEEAEIVHSAHEHRTSAKAYRRMEALIRRTPDLHRLVRPYGDRPDKAGYRKANGEQQIELWDGRLLQYNTRSGTATRGFSSPKIILDEAQELDADQMAAILPTVSAMPNHQVWFLGTPPRRADAWCYGLRDDGERGTPRLAHFDWGAGEWSDTPECQALVDDPETVYATNPAVGIRIGMETVEDERRPSGLGVKFAFERLGMWLPRKVGGGTIDPKAWGALADPESRRSGDVAIGVDIATLRDYAAISVYGLRELDDAARARGLETLGHGQMVDYRPGVDWLPSRVAELRAVLDPVAIGMGRSTYATLKAPLEQLGITVSATPDEPERGDLVVISGADQAAACGHILDDVRTGALRYVPVDQLTTAATGAKAVQTGDTVAWSRRGVDVETSPLGSLSMARRAYAMRAHLIEEPYDALANIW